MGREQATAGTGAARAADLFGWRCGLAELCLGQHQRQFELTNALRPKKQDGVRRAQRQGLKQRRLKPWQGQSTVGTYHCRASRIRSI